MRLTLCFVCWPPAFVFLVLHPLIWSSFRLLGLAVTGVSSLIAAIFCLP